MLRYTQNSSRKVRLVVALRRMIMSPDRLFLRMIATAFLAGELSAEQIVARTNRVLGKSYRWLPSLVKRFLRAASGHVRPQRREVIWFLRQDRGLIHAWNKYRNQLVAAQWTLDQGAFYPIPASLNWQLPRIDCVGELADWLNLNVSELEWFADLKGLDYRRSPSPLSHYNYRLLTKRSGIFA
jgi:RNA-directed DNA polymerase